MSLVGDAIVVSPLMLVAILILSAKLRGRDWRRPTLLAVSLSSLPVIFYAVRIQGPWPGGADIAFGLLMLFSPIFSLPLAIAGWLWAPRISLSTSILISLCAGAAYLGISLAYVVKVKSYALEMQNRSQLNCATMPYHCLIKDGDFAAIEQLKKSGQNIENPDGWGRPPLFAALFNQKALATMLENGANPNSVDNNRATPLARVLVDVVEPNFAAASLLLTSGADINRQYGSGKQWTVLNAAISNKNLAVVKFLLEKGADPTVKDDYGHNACDRVKLYSLQNLNLLECAP